MRGYRGQSFLPDYILIFLVLAFFGVFGYFAWHELHVSEPAKTTNALNVSNMTSQRSTPSGGTSTNDKKGCVFVDAYWAKGNAQLAHSSPNETVDLFLETQNCAGTSVMITIYQKNAAGQSVVKKFDIIAIVSNYTSLSWKLTPTVENVTSYYFSVATNFDSTLSIQSPPLVVDYPASFVLANTFLCQGFGDDRDYLYAVNTTVFTKSNGKQSFISTLNGNTLRSNNSDDQFIYDNSNGALTLSYSIVSVCGGVDIIYNVANPTSQSQLLPDFLFGGLEQAKTNPKYLELRRGGMLTSGVGKTAFYAEYYPSSFVYSPVTVAVSDDLSQGTSIQYPFLDYKVETIPQMSWAADGSIFYRYVLVYNSPSAPQKGSIAPGTSQHYTISLRFAPSRNWLLTLEPYKRYFVSQYGSVQKSSKNLRPVAGVSEAYEEYVNATNPRGYVYWYTGKLLNEVGWGEEVTRIISTLKNKGYNRLMLWQTAGMYDPKVCIGCNFPSQAMNWLPKLVETQGELQRIKQAGISLGFWWGRSSQVTLPDIWPPASIASIINANYSDATHHAYLMNQFTLATGRDADALGLDSFTFMEPYGRYKWLEEMQSRVPSLEYIQEHGGADIFHARSTNFYTDQYSDSLKGWDTLSGPSVLSWYLNPGSEVWAYAVASPSQLASIGQSGMQTRAQQLTRWGYTYVDNGVYTDVSSLDLSMSTCLDGKDNNGNGLVDWPRDNSCENEFDESES